MLAVRLMARKYKYRNNILLFLIISTLILLAASESYAGSVTLSWEAPATNEDGTPLNDLAGYKIYYGTSSRNYSFYINVGNVNSYTVYNLTEGVTYYFAVTAYDVSGNESKFSNEVSKTIEQVQTISDNTQVYNLTVIKKGMGSGTILSTPAGINCGHDCTESYSAGSLITLRAVADSNSSFAGWSGDKCSGNSTQCILTLNEDTTITANFESVMKCSISGTVSSINGPISYATVELSKFRFGNITTLTDINGRYCFSGLERGIYSIKVREEGYSFYPSIRRVRYFNSEVGNQDFFGSSTANLYFSVSGRVIQYDGNPMEGVTVTIKGAIEDITITDSHGNYIFSGLPQGSYVITPLLSEYRFTPSYRRVNIKGFLLDNQDFYCIRDRDFRFNWSRNDRRSGFNR